MWKKIHYKIATEKSFISFLSFPQDKINITFSSDICGMLGVLIIRLSQSNPWFSTVLSSFHLIPTFSIKEQKKHLVRKNIQMLPLMQKKFTCMATSIVFLHSRSQVFSGLK